MNGRICSVDSSYHARSYVEKSIYFCVQLIICVWVLFTAILRMCRNKSSIYFETQLFRWSNNENKSLFLYIEYNSILICFIDRHCNKAQRRHRDTNFLYNDLLNQAAMFAVIPQFS